MNKILSCPFCGGDYGSFKYSASLDEKTKKPYVIYQIECQRCFGSGAECLTPQKAIEQWNTRQLIKSELKP